MATEEELASRPKALVILEVASMAAILLFSVVGNILSCIVMYQNARLRTWHNLLLLNVIIADLLAALICMPFVIAVLLTGRWALGRDSSCTISGYFNALLATVSVTSLAIISVSRYYLIVRFSDYIKIFKCRNVGVMSTAIWVVSAICTFPPVVGWGQYIFLPGGALCFLYFGSSVSYSTVFTVLMLGVPILVMVFCFTKVYLVVRKRRRATTPRETHKLKLIERKEISAAKTLFCVVVMVLLFWTPLVVIYILVSSGVTEIPRQVSLMTTFFALLPCACKPIIYFIMKLQFRRAFLRLVLGRRLYKLFVQVTPSGAGQKLERGNSTKMEETVNRTRNANISEMAPTEN